MCVRCYLKLLMGYIVLRNIFPLCLETRRGIKDESEPFSSLLWLWSAMETATNIYVGQTLVHRGTPCSCAGASATKGDDALSHWCNSHLHPCAQRPQTSTTATGAELGEKPALSSDTLVLRSPTCENLGATAHFKRHSPLPPRRKHTPLYLPNSETLGVAAFISHQNSSTFLLSKFKTK